MITKNIIAFGKEKIIGCDGKCEKAFGLNGRPFVKVSEKENDIAWLSDEEVGIAPESGKTIIVSEGSDGKPIPTIPDSLLNKWCYRECERCVSVSVGEELILPDFSKRKYNIATNNPTL